MKKTFLAITLAAATAAITARADITANDLANTTDRDAIKSAADADALAWFTAHHGHYSESDDKQLLSIGRGRGITRGCRGALAVCYAIEFDEAVIALSDAEAE